MGERTGSLALRALPNIARARLPIVYEAARTALGKCERIDECQDWADKSAALASYARQAEDNALIAFATRIRARAIRRCGELLREIETKYGRPKISRAAGGPTYNKTSVSKEAGLSPRQKKTALRVANVPAEEFEAAVESEHPPSIVALAERGRRPVPKPLIDFGDRTASNIKAATDAMGCLDTLYRCTERVSPRDFLRGALPREWTDVKRKAHAVSKWIEAVLTLNQEVGK